MRLWLVSSMIVVAGAILLAMIVLQFSLWRFRRTHTIVRDQADMTAFKRLASSQMYVSLIALKLTWVPLLVWLVGHFVLRQLTWLDGLLFVAIPFALQFALAAAFVGLARAVRRTPAADEQLTAERDRVADVWVNKDFPEW